jgi:hypothetical protein
MSWPTRTKGGDPGRGLNSDRSLGHVFGGGDFDIEVILLAKGDAVQFIKALIDGRRLEAFPGGKQSDFRDFGCTDALFVARDRSGDGGLEIVSDDTEFCRLRHVDVLGPINFPRIGVVDDNALLHLETDFEQSFLAMARFEHVAVHAHMGGVKTVFVKG